MASMNSKPRGGPITVDLFRRRGGSGFRTHAWADLVLVGSIMIGGCGVATPRSVPPVEPPVDARSFEASLRADAAVEAMAEDDIPVREVSFEGVLQSMPAGRRPTAVPDPVDPTRDLLEVARSCVDLAVAPVTGSDADGPVSREATRRYLEGRTAIADGRPGEAIEALRDAVRRGGGVAALRALAEACDLVGRSNDATEVRRELARRAGLDEEDRARLVEALVRRRAIDEALAVQAPSVINALQPSWSDGAVRAAVRFAELLDLAGRDADARLARAAVEAVHDRGDVPGLAFMPEERIVWCRFWTARGDDLAGEGDLAAAARRWSRAAALSDRFEPALRARRLRADWALGRDLGVQQLFIEAADDPTADDLALAAQVQASDPPIEVGRAVAILERRAVAEGGMSGALRLLLALEPVQGRSVLSRLAAQDRGAVAGPLVAAAFVRGPREALEMAITIDGSMVAVDAAVDAVLSGPVDPRPLLDAAREVGEVTGGSPVLAELWRRHERPDLAAAALVGADDADPVVRIAWLRLWADLAEPTQVLAVPTEPFDVGVEVARINALLASGEPEVADDLARGLLDQAPEDPTVLAVVARVASTRLGGEVEAVEFAAKARRGGDRSLETMLDLAGFASMLSDGEAVSATARRTLAELADDPTFRALLDADAAMAAGDAATAIARLEPWLSDLDAREAVLIRLLAAWRAAGRLSEGRWRLETLAAERPADPVPADALFAIDRAMNGPRATAIDLRPQAVSAISGHPRRRLEMVLADIPESAAEARRLSAERLERRPAGPAAYIQRLANLLDADGDDDSALDAALAAVERLDVEALTPRLRRRLASVAAAIPGQRGAGVIGRIAKVLPEDEAIDVDTAIAIAMTLDDNAAGTRLEGRPLAAPWTRLDPTWRSRLAPLAAREVHAADQVAELGLATPAASAQAPEFLRTAVAISMLAGVDGRTLLDRMDRAAAIGWDPAAAWADGDADDLRRLAAVASDATMLGREDLSIELMERAVDAQPDDPVLLNNLGYALLERGRIEDATPLLERSREIDPDSASTLDSMGWLRFHQGRHDATDPESAISLIRRSLAARIAEGRAPSAEVLLHLGDASWAAGDRETAEDVWRRIAAPVSEVDRARRLEGIRSYQIEVWGGELVPSEAIDHLLEGRWSERAVERLDAVRAGRPPIGRPGMRPPSDA